MGSELRKAQLRVLGRQCWPAPLGRQREPALSTSWFASIESNALNTLR